MAKVTNLKRLKADDFEQEDQALVERLAINLNPFLEQVSDAFNGNIGFDNLSRELVSITTELDGSGVPKRKVESKSGLKTRIKGMNIISATNETDDTFPTGAPFITYALTTAGFEIKHITGLPANKKFTITIEVIG